MTSEEPASGLTGAFGTAGWHVGNLVHVPHVERRGRWLLAGFALLAWLGSGIYKVSPDEQGVVLLFGRAVGTELPGLHYHLQLLSANRDAIIRDIRQTVADAARPLGIEVVDVSIRRADLPPETSQAIYDRMSSERQREAKELRAQGFEWAQEIQAKADRERAEILADAQLKASIARAGGDAEASALLAAAFGRDQRFFEFYRAMQTYRHALAQSGPTLILSPVSELLRYFNAPMPEPAKP